MSRYKNEAGEFLMTASEMRVEDELDDMARYEPSDPEEDNRELWWDD